jgi:lipopolysaccharide export system protein LptC
MIDTARHNDPALVWAPRRQLTLSQARARSETVLQLRRLFMAAAAVSIGFFIGHVVKNAIMTEARPQISSEDTAAMKNPRFTGRDAAGKAFTIIASSAERDRVKAGLVGLAAPIMTDELGTEVRAPRGEYDQDAGLLKLHGDVEIKDATGYIFKTRDAIIHVNENRVEGLSPLVGKGPLGDIRSDSYEILDGGSRVVFSGRVRAVINQAPRAPDAPVETLRRETP